MDTFDWTSSIKPHMCLLRLVGLWPKDSDSYQLNLYTVYASLAAVVILGGHNLSSIINIFYVYNDIHALIGIIFVATTNILATTKMYLFARNLKVFRRLLATLDTTQFRPQTYEHLKLVKSSLRVFRKIYIFAVVTLCVSVGLWSITPFLSGGVKNYQLPFESWYPIKTNVSPNYEILYVYQLVCIWPISLVNIHLDSLIFVLMMYTRIQCDLLCHDLSSIEDDDGFNAKLVNCISHHKAILRFAKDSNNFFNYVVLGQMATSTAVLASTMFQLTTVNPASGEALGHIVYIFGIGAQIFLYCWFGNEVDIHSSGIIYALYESKWFQQPLPVKRNLLILSIRCNRPIKMTAINLFSLSLELYVNILRMAWSYFAVLYSVDK